MATARNNAEPHNDDSDSDSEDFDDIDDDLDDDDDLEGDRGFKRLIKSAYRNTIGLIFDPLKLYSDKDEHSLEVGD